MKSTVSAVIFCACIIVAECYGKSGSADWNSIPVLPIPQPLPPPPPPPMPIVQEIYPIIPLIPEPQPLPMPQPFIFQQFGFQGDFMHHNFGNKYGHRVQMPLHRIAPLIGFGSGIGGGFRTGFMQDPWCEWDVFGQQTPFYNDGFQIFQQRTFNPNFNGVVRRNEFAQKFQPQPTFQPKFPVGPKEAGGLPVNPNLS